MFFCNFKGLGGVRWQHTYNRLDFIAGATRLPERFTGPTAHCSPVPTLQCALHRSNFPGSSRSLTRPPLHCPASLSALSAPTGCGKSNVIDAVRWCWAKAKARGCAANRWTTSFQRWRRTQTGVAPAWNWCLTTPAADSAGQWSAVRRAVGEARGCSATSAQLLHQQSGPAATCDSTCSRHRPWARARLRGDRAGMISHHRGQAGRAARVPRRGRRRLALAGSGARRPKVAR